MNKYTIIVNNCTSNPITYSNKSDAMRHFKYLESNFIINDIKLYDPQGEIIYSITDYRP
jgi:hypothetical protein